MALININRIERVVKFDNSVFKEIRDDDTALMESFVTYLLAGIIGGIWQFLSMLSLMESMGSNIVLFLIIVIVIIFIGIPIGLSLATLISWVPAKMFGGKSTFIGHLKVLAYSSAPTALGIIPLIGPIVGGIWSFICEIVAVREVHEISTGKAIVSLLIIPLLIVGFIIALILVMMLLAAG